MQLFDAGPVKIYPPSHKRGATPVITTCAEPGCNKTRRLRQGARYCEEHARGIDYVQRRENIGQEIITCSCGEGFKRSRTISVRPAVQAWYEFCPACRHRSPLTVSQLRRHRVPYDTAVRWLEQRDELCCERPGCGKRFTRGGKGCPPHIDHIHACCPGRGSCGDCVRSVVCQPCNMAIGQLEYLLISSTLRELEAFIQNRCK